MAERFSCSVAGVASGTNKTIINLFQNVAAPTSRPAIYYIMVSSDDTPADQAARLNLARTTAVGTEGAGFVPVNLDPGGPAGECDSGNAHSAEPTYTSVKELLVGSVNERVTFQWYACFPGSELRSAATQNSGNGLRTVASTSTQAHEGTLLFEE